MDFKRAEPWLLPSCECCSKLAMDASKHKLHQTFNNATKIRLNLQLNTCKCKKRTSKFKKKMIRIVVHLVSMKLECTSKKCHASYLRLIKGIITQSCSSSSSSFSLLRKLVIMRVCFIDLLTLFLLVVLPFVLLPCCVLANSKLLQNFNNLAKFLSNIWKTLAYTTTVNFPSMMQ